jgi:hypothetical protein
MSITALALRLFVGTSFTGAIAAVAGNAGFDPTASSPIATFRQVASDTPIVQLTSTLSPYGSVTFLTPVPNYPYLPFGQTSPILVTLYPVQVYLTVAAVAAMPAYLQWSLIFDYGDGNVFPFIESEVTVSGV